MMFRNHGESYKTIEMSLHNLYFYQISMLPRKITFMIIVIKI